MPVHGEPSSDETLLGIIRTRTPHPADTADVLELRRRALVRDFAEFVAGRRRELRHSFEEIHALLADLKAAGYRGAPEGVSGEA